MKLVFFVKILSIICFFAGLGFIYLFGSVHSQFATDYCNSQEGTNDRDVYSCDSNVLYRQHQHLYNFPTKWSNEGNIEKVESCNFLCSYFNDSSGQSCYHCNAALNITTCPAGQFYYAGGTDESPRCVTGTQGASCSVNSSSDKNIAYCYNDQVCTSAKCFGLEDSWCGSPSQGSHNEFCASGYLCQKNFPKGPNYDCTKTVSTSPNTNGNPCEENGNGYYCDTVQHSSSDQKMPISCGNKLGLCYRPVNSTSQTPTGNNTCTGTDDNDSAFKCESSCDNPTGNPSTTWSTDTTNNGPLYKCGDTGGLCCRNDSIYHARPGKSGIGTNTGSTPPSSSTKLPSGDTTPGASPAPTGACAAYGGPDTNFSKPDGYVGPVCDGELYDSSKVATAKKGRQYADRYQCLTGGKRVDVNFSTPTDPTNPCDHKPWLNTDPTPAPVSKCASTEAQPCTIGSDGQADNSGTICCLPNQNLFCSTAGQAGHPTCRYVGGLSPTPTPGASNNCAVGSMQVGCRCDSPGGTGGCSSNLDCKPSFETSDGKSTKSFCVPFPASQFWCETAQSLKPTDLACTGATPYVSPTAVPTESPKCPNDGNHLCVPLNSCQSGFGPSNDTVANTACAGWNSGTPLCYTKGASPLSTCSVATEPPAAKPTTPPSTAGCPIDNGDGRVNSCQATCGGSYPNARTGGNGDCVGSYGTSRGACCTSN